MCPRDAARCAPRSSPAGAPHAALSLLYTRSYTYNAAQIGLLEPPGFQFGFPGGPLSPRFSLGSIVMYGLSTNLYGGSGFLQKTSEYWFLTLASDIICCGDLFISIIRRSYGDFFISSESSASVASMSPSPSRSPYL